MYVKVKVCSQESHVLVGKCTALFLWQNEGYIVIYRGAEKSLARPTSRFILFDSENISFDASLVIYINSTNIPPIMIINRICEYQNLLSLWLVSGWAKDLSAPLY